MYWATVLYFQDGYLTGAVRIEEGIQRPDGSVLLRVAFSLK